MFTRLTLWLLVFAVAVSAQSTPATQSAPDLKQLKGLYEKKTLTLRHLHAGQLLHYKSDGSLTDGLPGPWTLDGLVRVKKVKLSDKRIEFECVRIVAQYKKKDRIFDLMESGDAVSITLNLDAQNDFRNALDEIFLRADENLEGWVPAYWKAIVSGIGSDGKLRPNASPADPAQLAQDFRQPKGMSYRPRDSHFYKVGGDVSQPNMIYAPEPRFSILARSMRVQGHVTLFCAVTEAGTLQDIRIIQPLGLGLDDNAVATASTWRFEPAMRNGVPVTVFATLEVEFKLY